MTDRWHKVFTKVLCIHLFIFIFILLISFFKGCFNKNTSSEIITFIEFPDSGLVNKSDQNLIYKEENRSEETANNVQNKSQIWKPTPVSEIRKGKKISSLSKITQRHDSVIKKSLKELKRISDSSDPFTDYNNRVIQLIYQRWVPPKKMSGSFKVPVVRFDLEKDGSILNFEFIEKSGISSYDKSVKEAVEKIKKLPALPSGYPKMYIEVVFRIK
tara:strand:- start:994 stop:1638 length:645 start_codon:yes stop_codon:yes gene_type:complete